MSEIRLPRPLKDYIDFPSTNGERNDRLKDATIQFRDCRMGNEADAVAFLLSFAVDRDGLPEREVKATIHSIFTRPAREVPLGTIVPTARPTPIFRAKAKGAEKKTTRYILSDEFKLPEGMTDPAKLFLTHLFREGEFIHLVSAENEPGEKETVSPIEWHTFTREKFLSMLDDHFVQGQPSKIFGRDPHGVYFCVNPLGKTSPRRTQDNIADYRHALIEFDSIEKEKQYQLIEQSRIPCAAITDSGGKSIHAVVKVNARNANEYRERVEILMEHFREYGVDPKTKDPTRLSRLPGAVRGDNGGTQKLLCLTMGCATFEEWYAEQVSTSEELPDKMEVDELLGFDTDHDPDNLVGDRFLCKGSAFIISGQSGIGKSSFGLQMSMCWAVGRDFFGMKAVRQLKVMVVQSENDLGDMAEAFQGITEGLKFTEDEKAALKKNVVVYRDTSHTGQEFLSMLHTLIAREHPDIVLIDPLLAVVGDDVCEAKVVGEFFRRGLNALMQVTKVVVILMHHVPKPTKDDFQKSHTDLSYAGSGSSDLTNWSRAVGLLREHPQWKNNGYQFLMNKRHKRTGLKDGAGNEARCIDLQHGVGNIFWKRMDTSLIDELEKRKASKIAEAEALKRAEQKKKKDEAKAEAEAEKEKELAAHMPEVGAWLAENPMASKNKLEQAIAMLYRYVKGGTLLQQMLVRKWILTEPIEGAAAGQQKEMFVYNFKPSE